MTVAVSSRVMSRRMMGRNGNLRIFSLCYGLGLLLGPCPRRITLSLGASPHTARLHFILRPQFPLSRHDNSDPWTELSLSRDAAPRLPYWLYRVAALRRASSVAFAVYVSLHIRSANLMMSSRGVPWGNMHKGCAHARQKGWVERLNDSGSGEWTITRCWKATLSKSR